MAAQEAHQEQIAQLEHLHLKQIKYKEQQLEDKEVEIKKFFEKQMKEIQS